MVLARVRNGEVPKPKRTPCLDEWLEVSATGPRPMQLASAVQACPEGTPPSGSAPARNPGADGIVRLGFPVQQARRRPSLRRWTGRGRPNRPRRHRPA